MSELNKLTNAGALKLQHASATQLQARPAGQKGIDTPANKNPNIQFADLLQQEAERSQSVHFSKHAVQRVQERGIEMTDSSLHRRERFIYRQRPSQRGGNNHVRNRDEREHIY